MKKRTYQEIVDNTIALSAARTPMMYKHKATMTRDERGKVTFEIKKTPFKRELYLSDKEIKKLDEDNKAAERELVNMQEAERIRKEKAIKDRLPPRRKVCTNSRDALEEAKQVHEIKTKNSFTIKSPGFNFSSNSTSKAVVDVTEDDADLEKAIKLSLKEFKDQKEHNIKSKAKVVANEPKTKKIKVIHTVKKVPEKKKKEINECVICMGPLDKNIRAIECMHTFHDACISEWNKFKHECPICKMHFTLFH